MNIPMKGTIVMIAIMVPTLIMNIFSMNVRMPFNHESVVPFWVIMAISFVSLIGLPFIWRNKK